MPSITTRPGIKVKFGVKYPAKIVAIPPLTATLSGGTWTIGIDTAGIIGGDCWIWQLKRSLVDSGQLHNVDAAISADPSSTIAIAWGNGARTQIGDVLSNFIKSILGWTDAQMQALYANAKMQIL